LQLRSDVLVQQDPLGALAHVLCPAAFPPFSAEAALVIVTGLIASIAAI
jgi:hypothetical protein